MGHRGTETGRQCAGAPQWWVVLTGRSCPSLAGGWLIITQYKEGFAYFRESSVPGVLHPGFRGR